MTTSAPTPGHGVLGVGVDIADIARFQRLLSTDSQRVWAHWFTRAETELLAASHRPAASTAMRFAVKEATFKAVGGSFSKEVRWPDIEILGDEARPTVLTHGEVHQLVCLAGIHGFCATAAVTSASTLALVIAFGRPS